jgi:1,4-dihydroxy-2-naphthoyl-CoA hydrolase
MDDTRQGSARERLPDVLGLSFEYPERGLALGRFVVADRHMAPNGYMHAASVVALADSCCGLGCMRARPEGAVGFTTIELKTNFLGTARPDDQVSCEARLVHGGRTTQVWDAQVRNDTADKVIALFRCTQMILYPGG